jgi:hypothetical protein
MIISRFALRDLPEIAVLEMMFYLVIPDSMEIIIFNPDRNSNEK